MMKRKKLIAALLSSCLFTSSVLVPAAVTTVKETAVDIFTGSIAGARVAMQVAGLLNDAVPQSQMLRDISGNLKEKAMDIKNQASMEKKFDLVLGGLSDLKLMAANLIPFIIDIDKTIGLVQDGILMKLPDKKSAKVFRTVRLATLKVLEATANMNIDNELRQKAFAYINLVGDIPLVEVAVAPNTNTTITPKIDMETMPQTSITTSPRENTNGNANLPSKKLLQAKKQLAQAIEKKDLNKVKEIIESNMVPMSLSLDADGNDALHVAAKKGHLKTIKYLVSKGYDSTLKNYKGQTAAQVASFFKNPLSASYLELEKTKLGRKVVETVEKIEEGLTKFGIGVYDKTIGIKVKEITDKLELLSEYGKEMMDKSIQPIINEINAFTALFKEKNVDPRKIVAQITKVLETIRNNVDDIKLNITKIVTTVPEFINIFGAVKLLGQLTQVKPKIKKITENLSVAIENVIDSFKIVLNDIIIPPVKATQTAYEDSIDNVLKNFIPKLGSPSQDIGSKPNIQRKIIMTPPPKGQPISPEIMRERILRMQKQFQPGGPLRPGMLRPRPL